MFCTGRKNQTSSVKLPFSWHFPWWFMSTIIFLYYVSDTHSLIKKYFFKLSFFVLKGFASGSLDADAQPVRLFVADGGELLVAQSYAKNLGLYGERVGALSIVRTFKALNGENEVFYQCQ